MEQNIRRLLEELPSKPFRSKLEPHRELIRELRRKRRTYQEIAGFFGSHLQLHVAPSPLHNFLKLRSLLSESTAGPSRPTLEVPPARTLADSPAPRAKPDRAPKLQDRAEVLRSVRILLRFLRTVR